MSKNYTHIKDDLLVKHLLGEANAEETAQVEKWVGEGANNLKYFNDFKLLIEKSQLAPDHSLNAYEALDRLHKRMQNTSETKAGIKLMPMLRVAAAVIVVCTIGWFAWPTLFGSKQIDVQATENIVKQTLPDGSMITLNRNSLISYPGKFSGAVRAVKLTGEAFFKVQPNKKQPFVVSVDDVAVKVVGTSFNIKSRNGQTLIIVETGIVKVSRKGEQIELKAGERIRIQAQTTKLFKETNKGRLYDYYYSDELVCDNTPLWELVETLNEKFNANIVISNASLHNMPLTTTFKDQPLEQILQIVAQTFDIRVERQGQQILLK